MDNKIDASGNAHADGTDDTIWTTLADGSKVRPLQPGDKMWDWHYNHILILRILLHHLSR